MATDGGPALAQPPLAVLQQAAEWFAVLADPPVADRDQQAWQAWLAADPLHSAAWQRVEAVSRRFHDVHDDTPASAARAALSSARNTRRRTLGMLGGSLGMLLAGGIPVVTALGMVSGLLTHTLRQRLDDVIARIREGRGFAATLEAGGLTTAVAVRMLEVGERAGNLGEMLTRAALFHEEDTARRVEWLTRLFGPLLMLFIGCAIGLIVVLMYLPIFQLAESIG